MASPSSSGLLGGLAKPLAQYGYGTPRSTYGYRQPSAPGPPRFAPLAGYQNIAAAQQQAQQAAQPPATYARRPVDMQAAATGTAPVARPPAAAGGYDYSSDPVLQQIRALAGQTEADVTAGGLAAKKRLFLQRGAGDLARSLLGDEATALVAEQNPFSTRAQIKQGYERGVADLDESLNRSNLFYSGYRGDQMGRAAQDYQAALAQDNQQVNDTLGQINSGVAQALFDAQMRRAQAEADAQAGAAAEAAQFGFDPGDSSPLAQYARNPLGEHPLGPALDVATLPDYVAQTTLNPRFAGHPGAGGPTSAAFRTDTRPSAVRSAIVSGVLDADFDQLLQAGRRSANRSPIAAALGPASLGRAYRG